MMGRTVLGQRGINAVRLMLLAGVAYVGIGSGGVQSTAVLPQEDVTHRYFSPDTSNLMLDDSPGFAPASNPLIDIEHVVQPLVRDDRQRWVF
ncbi:hypothetical protein [Pseudomonas purpurea]|uniref:hypothetical protein n=1 Tax=Pseudomonas purpurea TaxID=3136737 RepID=UPI003267DCF9